MKETVLVLDSNVFVAAGFNPHSHSAQIVDAVRDGDRQMAWNEATRAEVRLVLQGIPPLSWDDFAGLFREEQRFSGETRPEQHSYVGDPADRKFIALAEAVQAPLVTLDNDLLGPREQAPVPVLTPEEYLDRFAG